MTRSTTLWSRPTCYRAGEGSISGCCVWEEADSRLMRSLGSVNDQLPPPPSFIP